MGTHYFYRYLDNQAKSSYMGMLDNYCHMGDGDLCFSSFTYLKIR